MSASRLVEIGHLAETAQADIVSHIRGKTEEPDSGTYQRAFPGWQCFHCGETFFTVAGARLHFGPTPDRDPACFAHPTPGADDR